MSDMSEGPGWWIASDDKWYPPHLHPSVRRSEAGVGHIEDDAGSDRSEGPGWWIASDDKWYPPHLHPSVRRSEAGVGPADLRSTQHDSIGPSGNRFAPGAARSTTDTPAKSWRRPVAVLAGLVAVLALISGAITIFGHTESASAKVVDAASTTLHDGTARVTASVSGETSGSNLTATGSGVIDFTDNALQMQMTVSADGQRVPIQEIYEGGQIYESIPGADVVPGKSWISINLSALKHVAAQDPTIAGLGNNPSVVLQMLSQQGNTVVSLGPSTVDGVAVAGYSVSVDPSREEQKLKKADLPAWMQQAVAGLQVQKLDVRVSIDKAGLLRSLTTQLAETSNAAGSVTSDETLNFSDYGQPVTVTAPPASQVESIQQVLHTLLSEGSASS